MSDTVLLNNPKHQRFWVVPERRTIRPTMAMLIPALTTQYARYQGKYPTALYDNGHITYAVGKTGYIRFWNIQRKQHQTILVKIDRIYFQTDVCAINKKLAALLGHPTVRLALEAYIQRFGEDALNAPAWEIVFTRVNKPKSTQTEQDGTPCAS